MNTELYEEYERLLLERDAKVREAGSYRTAYIQQFGALINKSFELKLECIKKKKSIAFCRRYVNCGHKVNISEMQRYLGEEMTEYNKQLEGMLKTYELCKNAKTSTEMDVLKAKSLYRKLAKRLHPDMNPATSENENLKEIWERVTEAYHQNDPEKLQELEVLMRVELERLNMADEMPEIENVEEKIRVLKKDIDRIVNTDPYQYSELLGDTEVVEQKRQDLQTEIDECTRYAQELEAVLQNLLQDGMVMLWQTN